MSTQSTTVLEATGPRRPKAPRWVLATVPVLVLLAGALAVRMHFLQRTEPLDPLRGDSDDAVSALAAKIGAMPDSAQVTTLQQYATDPSPSLRYAAIDQIGGRRDDPAAAATLENAYTDSSSIVRQRALEDLPDIDPDRGLHLLLAGLRDEDSWMREAAVTQLKSRVMRKNSIIDQRALPSLFAALDDSDRVVPFTIVAILEKLTGKTWHYRALAPDSERQKVLAEWKSWWANERASRTASLASDFATPVAGVAPTRTDPAPPFQLPDVDGRTISLSGQKGRVTLLNFWGTWCAPCMTELPDLIRLDHDYRGRGVDVIGIALAEHNGPSGLKAWCAAHGIDYRQALAEDPILRDYGNIQEVPISVLIDADGHIRRRWEGERDYDTFRGAVDSVLGK